MIKPAPFRLILRLECTLGPAPAYGHAHSNPSALKNPPGILVTYDFIVRVLGGIRIHTAVYLLETSLMSEEMPANRAPSGTGML